MQNKETQKTQREFLQEALDLASENPELEIQFCIDSDELSGYSWDSRQIRRIDICPWYENSDGEIFIAESDIRDEFSSDNIPRAWADDKREEEMDRLFKTFVRRVICIFTT